jgi:hypothetical protein
MGDAHTKPDYSFLSAKHGIQNLDELKDATVGMLKAVGVNVKRRDFEHLLLNKRNSERILSAGEFLLK